MQFLAFLVVPKKSELPKIINDQSTSSLNCMHVIYKLLHCVLYMQTVAEQKEEELTDTPKLGAIGLPSIHGATMPSYTEIMDFQNPTASSTGNPSNIFVFNKSHYTCTCKFFSM